MKLVILILAIVVLNLLQVTIRQKLDFYAGDLFVSFLIGAFIGFVCVTAYNLAD